MATADFELSMEIDASIDDTLKILEVMKEYIDQKHEVYFTHVKIDKDHNQYNLESLNQEELTKIISSSQDTLGLTALGPYGHFMYLEDIKLFKDMSDKAPYASFEAEIIGNTTYTDQKMICKLKDTNLHTSVNYVNDEERTDMYLEYVSDVLPYNEFVDLFKVDDLEYDDYVDFMGDLLLYKEESISDIDYGEFTDLLFAECGLDEEHYNDVVRDLDIMSYEAFSSDHEDEVTDSNEYDYKPLVKEQS